MAKHADSIGFKTEEDFLGAVFLSLQNGGTTLRNNYGYHNLKINDGIELLSITYSNTYVTSKPYFKSKSSIPVTLSDTISTGAAFNCEKRLIAYSIPDEFPIPFDYSYEQEIPLEIDIDKEYNLFLTAFAHILEIYKNPDDFVKKIPVPPERSKSFGATEFKIGPNFYMHFPGGPVLFGGRVSDTKIIINSLTQQQVRWVKIDNILGNLEIVYPEKELEDELLKEYYIVGEFWLIGYIDSFRNIESEQNKVDKPDRTTYKTHEFDVAYM